MAVLEALPPGIRIEAGTDARTEQVLTPAALAFLAFLHRRFDPARHALLQEREARQRRFDAGERPSFPASTAHIRALDWTVAAVPEEIRDRRVEITGPVDRKMVINALNSGAQVFMADFEDSNAPTWDNNINGQINLHDAVRRTITLTDGTTGKHYQLNERTAVLFVRPRGWHLEERGLLIDDAPISGGLFDLGLFLWHNAHALIARGSAPYFYLPKLEGHLEARLWNEVFVAAQEELGIPRGTIKATVLIETLPAAFEMDEILYELREHSAGLNCGRWDYIFSFIKRLGRSADTLFPDRDQVTMASPCMDAYSRLLVKTCHRRRTHAMGGMAAFIPIKDDPQAHAAAIARVRADKEREVHNGHDGTWVAHPALVAVAREVFDAHMPGAHQYHVDRANDRITAGDLLAIPTGTITEAGLRKNINVCIQYIASWLRGNGAAAINHLMEDAATAEISRTQVWQWIQYGGRLDDGRSVTLELVEALQAEEVRNINDQVGDTSYITGRYILAAEIFHWLVAQDTLEEFLTVPAYDYI